MRRRHALALLLAAAMPAAPALAAPERLPDFTAKADRIPSGAGEIRMMQLSGETRERALVESLVPEAAGQPLETGVYDLNEDGRPEVVARLKGSKFCDAKEVRCRTLVFRNGPGGWEKVLDRKAQRVEAGNLGFGGMRAIVLDGREAFNWNGTGYRIDIAAAGTPVAFQEAPASFRAPLLAQFGVGAGKLAARNTGVVVKVAPAALNDDGSRVVVARLEGPGACGMVLGCPWRILQVKGGSYVPLSEGLGGDKMSVLPVMRGGYRDILVGTPRGWSVYGWTGKGYVLSEANVEGSK